jgi:hypothetical protein
MKEEAFKSACIAAGLERLLTNEMLWPGKRDSVSTVSVTELQLIGQWARRVGERGLWLVGSPDWGWILNWPAAAWRVGIPRPSGKCLFLFPRDGLFLLAAWALGMAA